MVIFTGVLPSTTPFFFPTPDGGGHARTGSWIDMYNASGVYDPSSFTMRRAWVDFTVPVSRVRMYSSSYVGPVVLRCISANGQEVTSTVVGGNFSVSPWEVLDVSMPGIVRCIWEGGETQYISAFTFVPEEQPKIVLQCTGDLGRDQVTRGKSVRCEAAKPADVPGELAILGWSFERRARSDGDPTSAVWEGVMVRSGTVRVRGRIGGGEVEERSADIEVVARAWQDHLPELRIAKVRCPAPTTEECPLLSPLVHDGDVGHTRVHLGPTRLPFGHVPEGPNTGWSFIASDDGPIQISDFVIYLNAELYDPRSSFYRRSDCRPETFADVVEAHEMSHANHARELAARGYINMHFEAFVRFVSRDQFEAELRERARRDLPRRMKELVDEDHSTIGFLEPGCNTRLRPNRR